MWEQTHYPSKIGKRKVTLALPAFFTNSHLPSIARATEKEEIMIAIIGWIIFGLIAGLIAKAIMPGRDPGGAIITILIGIAGSVIGGFLGQALFGYGRNVNDSGDLSQTKLVHENHR